MCEGNIQQPAADTGARSPLTFRLHELPTSTTEKAISSVQTCQLSNEEKGGGATTYGDLDFVSVELGLDGSESPQLSKLETTEKENEGQRNNAGTARAGDSREAGLYLLDSPGRPTSREAPERQDHVVLRGGDHVGFVRAVSNSWCVLAMFCGAPEARLHIYSEAHVTSDYRHTLVGKCVHQLQNTPHARCVQMGGGTEAYFLIGVARGDGEHVGFVSEDFSPVPLTGLHAVLKVVLVVGVEGLRTHRNEH